MPSTRPDLDLTKYQFRRVYGDITVFGTWFGEHRRPALVLIPTLKEGRAGVTPCVVPLASAYLWHIDQSCGDPAHTARVSRMFAEALGMNPHNPRDCVRIVLVVQDCLDDLIKIPPKPTEKVVAADIIRTDQYGREHHAEVIDHV